MPTVNATHVKNVRLVCINYEKDLELVWAFFFSSINSDEKGTFQMLSSQFFLRNRLSILRVK